MKCWICGRDGKTGEHILKASDLKSYFGRISQEMPIYYHTKGKKNIPVGSPKSKRLKSKALICNDCNSSLTQPYDKAWEKLSFYLRKNWAILQRNGKLNLSKIFPGSTGKSLLDVHLYFVKLFGCRIVEESIPIEIAEFSNCLQQRIAHRDVYIAIGNQPEIVKSKYAAITPIESLTRDKNTVFAEWLYIIDTIAVKIIYSIVPGNEKVLHNTWHPNNANKIIKLAQL